MNLEFLNELLNFRGSWRRWGRSTAAFLIGGLLVLPAAIADEPSSMERFLRLQRSAEGDVTALETAVVRHVRRGSAADSGPRVDLIGAIHVGEREYYETINRRFRDYDVVLYELVAPSAKSVPQAGHRSGSPVTAMQVGMKNLLGLHFQLDCIDYRAPNLVHADLTTDQFAQSMSDRGESLTQMFFRLMGQSMALQAKDPTSSGDVRFLAALLARDRSMQLKRIMAEQFETTFSIPSVLDGPRGSTIITVRNRRAVDVLAEQLRGGNQRVAIFYGAAHLPDLQARLRERLDFVPSETSWLTAWKMRP